MPTINGIACSGRGVEKVVTIELDATERQMLESSAAAVRELISAAQNL